MFEMNFINFLMMLFFMGMMSFCLNRFHLLMILLSLEFIVLIIFMMLLIYLKEMFMEMYFSMFFLTFSVCEGVLGLSILILMVRFHGNENFQILNIL